MVFLEDFGELIYTTHFFVFKLDFHYSHWQEKHHDCLLQIFLSDC